MRIRLWTLIAVVAAVAWLPASPQPAQPGAAATLKFAVIGDGGTGKAPQFEVAQQMFAARASFPFELVLMLGDNMYGRQEPQDFVDKFERPYAALLQAGVPFYAALGNHDKQSNRDYKGFNMGGQRYFTFVKKHVRFVVLDTNLMDQKQVAWAEGVLSQPQNGWTICYFHHPIYSSGVRHGPDVELRVVLEPMMLRHGVDVVFSGHEHFYERIKPQKGITYFIEGSSGQLRKGGVEPSPITAVAYDEDQTFMLVEITGDDLSFRTISRTGRVIDSAVIHRQPGT
jgi:predicted phosphodiesterase